MLNRNASILCCTFVRFVPLHLVEFVFFAVRTAPKKRADGEESGRVREQKSLERRRLLNARKEERAAKLMEKRQMGDPTREDLGGDGWFCYFMIR